jgi:hypothetical protein
VCGSHSYEHVPEAYEGFHDFSPVRVDGEVKAVCCNDCQAIYTVDRMIQAWEAQPHGWDKYIPECPKRRPNVEVEDLRS